MKKLIFILLIPFALKAQVNRVVLPGVISIIGGSTPQTINLAFTELGDNGTLPATWGHYNIEDIGTSQSLINTLGSSSGYFVINGGVATPSETGAAVASDANFPAGAMTNFFYTFNAGGFTIIISGLDNSKTYNIRVGTAFNAGGFHTRYTIGATTITTTTDFEDHLISTISPTSGAITISLVPPDGNACYINALILTQN